MAGFIPQPSPNPNQKKCITFVKYNNVRDHACASTPDLVNPRVVNRLLIGNGNFAVLPRRMHSGTLTPELATPRGEQASHQKW